MSVLVIAPHPDDEVLGVGASIARFSQEGKETVVLIVTKGRPPLFESLGVERVRNEAQGAHTILGVKETIFFDFPSAELDRVPQHEVNAALGKTISEVQPEMVFVPFPGDVHMDHRFVFEAVMVAARPSHAKGIRSIYAYETLSETNWNAGGKSAPAFVPDCFICVDHQLERKLEAMKMYVSQLRESPHERSLEAIEALAILRGATVGVKAAESFVTIRRIV